MKKLPPFLLIRQSSEQGEIKAANPKVSTNSRSTVENNSKSLRLKKAHSSDEATREELTSSQVELARKVRSAKRLFNKLPSGLDNNFKTVLRSTLSSGISHNRETFSVDNLKENLTLIVQELGRNKELPPEQSVLRVGILDLGAWIGDLPTLIHRMNLAQPIFTLFEILAPIPSGLVKAAGGFANWRAAHSKTADNEAQGENIAPQMISDDFFEAGHDIRKAMGVDLLVGVTPALIAGIDEGKIFHSHFSRINDKTILISTADLRNFAQRAQRPYEAAVGTLLVTALMTAINSNLGYHDNTGCLFDRNENREKLVDTIRDMHIEPSCAKKMTPLQHSAAVSMLGALKRMKKRKST